MAKNREKTVERPQNKNLKKDAGPGRPVGQRNYSTIYREALIKLGTINNKTPEELETELIASGFAMAKKDYRFYKDVLDRIHGTATLKTDITSLGEKIGLTAEQQTKLDKLLNDK
jgi:hypothetical protein